MNAAASEKIAMLKDSMQVLTLGLLSLLPFVGLPFAFVALWMSGRVRKLERRYWNAAKPHRIWGTILAAAGAATWVVVGSLIAFNAATGAWNND